MSRRDPRPRHRTGALSEVQLDGSITLYGLEDWTQIRDDRLVETRSRTESDDPTGTGSDDEDGV